MRGLCANAWPNDLYFVNKWPAMGKGGLEKLSASLEGHRDVKLVIIDILAKFRWPKQRGENFYDWDYRTATAIRDVAEKYGVAIVIVHHTNKLQDSPDIYMRISGSQGLAAGADTLMLLERQDRMQREAQLAIAGREVEGQELIIQYDPDSGGWRLLGDAGLYNTSEERRQVLQFLEQCTMATPKEVAAGLGKNDSTIRNMMRTMANSGQLAECGSGRYAVPKRG
jgi:AAA domain